MVDFLIIGEADAAIDIMELDVLDTETINLNRSQMI